MKPRDIPYEHLIPPLVAKLLPWGEIFGLSDIIRNKLKGDPIQNSFRKVLEKTFCDVGMKFPGRDIGYITQVFEEDMSFLGRFFLPAAELPTYHELTKYWIEHIQTDRYEVYQQEFEEFARVFLERFTFHFENEEQLSWFVNTRRERKDSETLSRGANASERGAQELEKLNSQVSTLTSALLRNMPDKGAATEPTSDTEWGRHEQAGDKFKYEARLSNTIEDSRNLWSYAKDEYQSALALVSDSESIINIRLYRKISECYRRIGKLALAEQTCSQAYVLNRELTHVSIQQRNIEDALLRVEDAAILYAKEEWQKSGLKVEDIIGEYVSSRDLQIRYAVSHAYNLLASAISNSDYVPVNTKLSTEECWDFAKEKLNGLDTLESKQLLLDIKLNQAMKLNDLGHCDPAIALLEDICEHHIHNVKSPIDRLRIENHIIAKHNLAVGYLARRTETDLKLALTIAEENLSDTQTDFGEWIWAFRLFLTIIRQLMVQSDSDTKKVLLNRSESLRNEMNRTLRRNNIKNWEKESHFVEIQRHFTDIYLEAGQLEQANLEFSKIPNWRTLYRKDADICTTRALLSLPSDSSLAIEAYEQAFSIYENSNLAIASIDTLIQLAQLYTSNNRRQEAVLRIEKAKEIASTLDCQDCLRRVQSAAYEIHQPS